MIQSFLKLIFLISLLQLTLQTYSEKEAKYNLKIVNVANCPNLEQINSWTCRTCIFFPKMAKVYAFENPVSKIQTVIGYDEETNNIIVGFRGAVKLANWYLNFHVKQVQYEGYHCEDCKVHNGFQIAYLTVREFVLDSVKKLVNQFPKYKQIYVTGHSLGAALSTLAVLDITRTYGQQPAYYQFGSPRVGNQEFANYFNKNVRNAYRIVNDKDLITQILPHYRPQPMFKFWIKEVFYVHIGTEIWYNNSKKPMNYIVCKEVEDQKCQISLKNFQLNINDHLTNLGISVDICIDR